MVRKQDTKLSLSLELAEKHHEIISKMEILFLI